MANAPYAKQGSEFWETYKRGRPPIPPSFWERIFTYHASNAKHSAEFNQACDLGSGPGIHSPPLAARFNHVVLIDPGAENLNIARSVLSPSTSSSDHFTYILGTAEENHLPPESCDFIFAATMLHHTDPPVAIKSIASKLRPGGTFIATFACLPQFTNAKIRNIWYRMCDDLLVRFRKDVADAGPESPYYHVNVPRALEAQDSGYDSVAIPATLFEDVTRWKVNGDIVQGVEPFRMSQGFREEFPLVNRVAPDEKSIEERDADFAFSMDLDAFRALVNSFPFYKLDVGKLWDEVEETVRELGSFDGFYAVNTIMARRRMN